MHTIHKRVGVSLYMPISHLCMVCHELMALVLWLNVGDVVVQETAVTYVEH
jgi:hypothetical protein